MDLHQLPLLPPLLLLLLPPLPLPLLLLLPPPLPPPREAPVQATIFYPQRYAKRLQNPIKPLSKGVQTASKKNFTAKKAFIFVHLMNAFLLIFMNDPKRIYPCLRLNGCLFITVKTPVGNVIYLFVTSLTGLKILSQ